MLDFIKNYIRNMKLRTFLVMFCGVYVMGLGIAFLRFANLGTDPFSGMNLALSALTGIYYPHTQILINLFFFVIEIIWGRGFIGIGTFVNALLAGYFINYSYLFLSPLFARFENGNLAIRILLLIIGLLVTSLGLSMYQQGNLGVAPFDAVSLILHERIQKVPYFVFRVAGDAFCALVCFFAGGTMGIGMLVTAFGFGPVIQFFDGTLTKKLLGK